MESVQIVEAGDVDDIETLSSGDENDAETISSTDDEDKAGEVLKTSVEESKYARTNGESFCKDDGAKVNPVLKAKDGKMIEEAKSDLCLIDKVMTLENGGSDMEGSESDLENIEPSNNCLNGTNGYIITNLDDGVIKTEKKEIPPVDEESDFYGFENEEVPAKIKKRRGRPPGKPNKYTKPPKRKGVIKCPYCGYWSLRKDHLKRHVLLHPQQDLYKPPPEKEAITKTCSFCGYKTTRTDHFRRHLSRWHSCSCGFSPFLQSELIEHISIHGCPPREEPEPPIEQTKKKVKRKSKEDSVDSPAPQEKEVKLKRPFRRDQPFSCDICTYTTMRSDHFKRHVARHNNPKRVTSSENDDSDLLISEELVEAEIGLGMEANPHLDGSNHGYDSSVPANSLSENSKDEKRRRRNAATDPLVCEQCAYSTLRSDHFKRHRQRHERLDARALLETQALEAQQPPPAPLPFLSAFEDAYPDGLSIVCQQLPNGTDAKENAKRRRRGEPFNCEHCSYTSMRSDHFKRHVYVRHTNPRKPEKRGPKASDADPRPTEILDVKEEELEESYDPVDENDQEYVGGIIRTPKVKKRKSLRRVEPFTCGKCGYTTMRSDHFKRHTTRFPSHRNYKPKEVATIPDVQAIDPYCPPPDPSRPSIADQSCQTQGDGILMNSFNDPFAPGMAVIEGGRPDRSDSIIETVPELEPEVEDDKSRTKRGGPHTCEECGYSTMRSDHFKRHVMRHTGEKPFVCTVCDYRTTHSIHLKRHLATHQVKEEAEAGIVKIEDLTEEGLLVGHIIPGPECGMTDTSLEKVPTIPFHPLAPS